MRVDLHLHSCYSHDALSSPESIIREVKKNQLSAVAITEHNTASSWNVLERLCKKEKLPFIKGEEIKVNQGRKTVAELIGLFMNKEVKPAPLGEVLDELRKQDALVVVAHPFDWFRKRFRLPLSELKKVDAIEAFNSRTLFNSFNRKAMNYAKEHERPVVAGSDAHIPREIGNAFIECEADDLEELRKAILKKEVKIAGRVCNPLIHISSTIAKLGLIKSL